MTEYRGAAAGGHRQPGSAPVLVRLPEVVTTPRLELRVWRAADVPVLHAAVVASADHLRPWMWWAADEPVSLEERQAVVAGMERTWEAGQEANYGVFLDGEVVGGGGLHRRSGPEVLEIGYWIHAAHVGHGYASELAAALTTAAFEESGIERVEIHHDVNNLRSRAVPHRLGFALVAERPREVRAPAEGGTDCTWAMAREHWLAPVGRDGGPV